MPFYIRFPSASSNPSVGSNGAAIPGSSTLVAGEDNLGNLHPLQIDSSGNLLIAGTVTSTNPSVGTNGAAIPTSSTEVGFKDGSGDLQPGNITAAGNIKVDGSTVTQPVSAASLPLPTGASTAAKQPALGTAGTASTDVITVQGITSMTPIVVSAGALPLPTGAATEATLSALNAKVTAVNTGAVVVSSSALPTGAATETTLAAASAKLPATLGQKTMAASLAVVIASDQSALPVSQATGAAGGASGNSPGSTTVSTVATITAPASAMGFILMNLDTSTANVRWRIGGTASTTSGQQLQPGRDSGFIPCRANISIIAESGTQNYDIQWVIQ